MHDQSFTLSGDSFGVSQISPNIQKNSKSDTQDIQTDNEEIEKFISRFDFYVEIICQKADLAANQQESQEIMIAIQWFVFQEENIYQLSKNDQKVLKTYDQILEGIGRFMKSCLIYIRTDYFKCLYILQITAALSKVIFSFHIVKNDRFMRHELQKEFLDLSDQLKQQIEIEKNDLIQIQIQFYLFLTKTSFEMAPNNSNERNEILKGSLCGIIGSIAELKPTDELIQSLFKGACFLYETFYKLYVLKNKRIQYEVYFQLDMLQWEIISYFKNEKQKNLDQVLEKINIVHDKLVKNQNNWKNHYLWIQMMGKILVYNPLITEQKLSLLARSYNIEVNSRQIWKEYQNKGLIIQMNQSNDEALIQLNQFQNKQLVQLDRIILQDIFKEWQQFIFLKELLLNEQNQNQNFTFRYYLQNNFKINIIEHKLNKKLQDFNNNTEWKIKCGLVLTIIQISSNCFTDTVISFCQKTLIQLWVSEKDQRVRNLLKNQKLINIQIQILKKNWQTQHDRIAGEMQQMLKKIDQLQEQISHQANLNKRDLQLKEMDETTQQLDQYIENVGEMGHRLSLITDFINLIRKNLLIVKEKINEMKEQLHNLGQDIKYLKVKSVEQLLEIRKRKVLKEAAYKNVKSIYVPLKSQEKGKNKQINLMNLEQIEDRNGEVNEFLQEEEKIVMLIYGIAGSGKSTTAKKIEEFIWKLHENNKKIRNQIIIPVYISLPSLKNPVFQAVEETLLQDDYGFDNILMKECKQKLEKKEFRFLLIMDSYDEMKLENLQKNLYLSNKLKQNWSDPLVIFTTRSEIFTSTNYADWFAPEEKNFFKEVQLLKFDKYQTKEYLKKFTILSIKMLIFEIYEWQTQIQKGSIDINQFELSWRNLQSLFLEFDGQNWKSDFLLTQKQIQSILVFLKDDELIALKSNEALRSLSINFEKLWSLQKYENVMKEINSNKLVETPYMMEIIVQVLPQIMTKASDIIKMKENFINNFSKMFKAFLKSKYLIQMYKQQQKKHLIQLNNQIEDEKLEVTQSDVLNLEKIDYYQVALKFWDLIEDNSIPQQLQISSELNGLQNILTNLLQPILLLTQNKVEIKNESLVSLVCDALKEQNLTRFDFQSEFINYYHLRQIEKQKNLGKLVNIDRFLHDQQTYSIRLAKLMYKKQISQVQDKYQGLLYNEEGEEEKWLDEFFNDDTKNGYQKQDLRSCSLVQKKGSNFLFIHKSIQEFLIAADLYEVLILAKDLDVQILRAIIERFQREQTQDQDGLKFLQKLDPNEMSVQVSNLSLIEIKQKQNDIQKKINLIINLIQQIKQHDFNVINYSTENYTETRKYLIQKISKENNIIELLKFLVQLTKIDQKFIQSGSNSLNFLVQMKVDLTMQNFSNINIQNTSIVKGNFAKCNLNGSKLENVNINGINLNGAQLFNCVWLNLKLNELFQLEGHSDTVFSVSFSPNGTTLASGSHDNSIRLWDVRTGEQKAQLDGHSDQVQSVCFSPDGTTLASGSSDKSIRLWDVKTGKQKAQLDGHSKSVQSVCFSPDGTTLASGSRDKSIRLWDVKTGQLKAQLEGHSKSVQSVCFSPVGNTLASGSVDNCIRLWDVRTGQQKALLDGHSYLVQSVCFSPDGTTLASGSRDNSIRLWDVKTGEQKSQLDGNSAAVTSVCFSPNGTTLVSGSDDNSISLWDVKTGEQKAKLYGHSYLVQSVCFSPDGTTLASGGGDNSIRLWDAKTGEQKAQLDGHSKSIQSVCFSPDGTTLASGSVDNSIRQWDAKTGEQKALLDGHSKSVQSVCFSPDGTTLASGGGDNSIGLWDAKTGEQKVQLDGHSKSVQSICFSPDATKLASGSVDNSIRLWDVKTGEQKAQLDGHRAAVTSVCFSPDGTTLASGSDDNSIRLWDFNTGQQIQPQDKYCLDILEQFKIYSINHIKKVTSKITILLISQTLHFQAQSAIIFKGQFKNQQGRDLIKLFMQNGCFHLDHKLEQQFNLI